MTASSAANKPGAERRQLIEEIETSSDNAGFSSASSLIITPEIAPHFQWTLDCSCCSSLSQEQFDYNEDEEADEELEEERDSVEPEAFVVVGTSHKSFAYGFANRFNDADDEMRFSKLQQCFPDVVDFRTPVSELSLEKRNKLKWKREQKDFSDDHYLANVFEDEDRDFIEHLIDQKMPWDDVDKFKQLTEQDKKDCIEKLKNRNYLLDFEDQIKCFLSLVDIIFSFCYDMRVTNTEHCAESSWNISKLCGTLSWFCHYHSLMDVARSCYRRSLIYPLFRSYDLATKVWQDTLRILEMGRESVLHCLLEIRRVFAVFDSSISPKYILNDVYITDYCIWIQKIHRDDLQHLVNFAKAKMWQLPKSEINLDIVPLEDAGLAVLEEDDDARLPRLRKIVERGRSSDEMILESVMEKLSL